MRWPRPVSCVTIRGEKSPPAMAPKTHSCNYVVSTLSHLPAATGGQDRFHAEGGLLPRYICANCGRLWARTGPLAACTKCGEVSTTWRHRVRVDSGGTARNASRCSTGGTIFVG